MKKLIIASLLTLLSSKAATAQDFHFDEMTYSSDQTTFKLFAPKDAKKVIVRLYKDGVGGKALKTVKMQCIGDDLWSATVKGDQKGLFYTFDIGRGETPGVFAKAVGVNGKRGAILRDYTSDCGWDQERPVVKSPADLVIYEMHHRDFSVARPDAKYPGKFLALTEPWAIDHLKELGVNAVHILPSYDYGSVDETRLDEPQYNWGYDPVNYNVPEGSYSTDPTDPLCRIREFKQMVEALHKAGICVILDVVYNHTYDIEHSNFQRTYPDYYYRKIRNDKLGMKNENEEMKNDAAGHSSFLTSHSSFSNGSGCGNETASEKPMMRRFMIESVKYWVNEYHIDGFRFDLMGCHDIETMNAIRKALDEIDPTIFVYGEGWSAGACALPNEQLGMKANIPQMPGIAAFSDDIRDALRGPFSDDTKGAFLAGIPGEEESLKAGIAGMIAHPQVDYSKVNYSKVPYALQPTQMISYVSCHDDMCLVDRLKASIPSLTDAEANYSLFTLHSSLIKLDLLAQTAVFTSQGIPFMLSGEELLRTKKGVHNSFESPDSINQLCWSNKARYPHVFEYYKNLIALRKHHPAFRLGSADLVRKHLEFLQTDDCLVAFRLKNYAGRDDWRNIIVILNANSKSKEVTVPAGTYTKVCCDGVINEQGLGTVTGPRITVSAQSALILHD
ncbi:MAG: type I pullulanase [Prevotella sp.]|nr:type I pullulanase [Prevotella sp.]